jgi:hypothetical protein
MIDQQTYRQGIEELNKQLEQEKNDLIRTMNAWKKDAEKAKQDLFGKWQNAKNDLEAIQTEWCRMTLNRCWCGKRNAQMDHIECTLDGMIRHARRG